MSSRNILTAEAIVEMFCCLLDEGAEQWVLERLGAGAEISVPAFAQIAQFVTPHGFLDRELAARAEARIADDLYLLEILEYCARVGSLTKSWAAQRIIAIRARNRSLSVVA